jgi:hypothetical protein
LLASFEKSLSLPLASTEVTAKKYCLPTVSPVAVNAVEEPAETPLPFA